MPVLRLVKTLFLIAVATVLSFSLGARAKDKKSSDADKTQVEAAEAFKTGQALFNKGEYLEAATAFERAYHLAPHPAVLANIGYCYEEAGDYPRAVEVFRKYLKQPNPDRPDSNREIAALLKKLERKVGNLLVNCRPTRCEVTVDNIPRGMAPTSLVLLAGTHIVDVAAVDGIETRHYEVTIKAGGEFEVDADLSASPPSPYQPPPVKQDKEPPPLSDTSPVSQKASPRLRAPFWVATAATVAGAGSVAVFAGLTHKTREQFDEGGSTDAELKERGENLRLGTNIAIGVTAAAATTALVLAIVDLKRDPEKNAKNRKAAQLPKFRLNLNGWSFIEMSVAFH